MSIPAPYRAVLRPLAIMGEASLILWPSKQLPCIEAWPAPAFEALAVRQEQVDPFSTDQDDFATSLYADAWPVEPDKEGRIVVPDSLVQHAGLTDSVTFMGLGARFQIWEPAAGAQRKSALRGSPVPRRPGVPDPAP